MNISKFVQKEISFYDILKDEKRAQLYFENNQVYFATSNLLYQFKNNKFYGNYPLSHKEGLQFWNWGGRV